MNTHRLSIDLMRAAAARVTAASRITAMLGIALIALFSASITRAHGYGACAVSANQMFIACQADRRDDYFVTRANCTNISEDDERKDCQSEARDTLWDDAWQCLEQRRARINACTLLGEDQYDPDPLLDPTLAFVDPNDIPDLHPVNPYVSLAAGHTFVLRAGEFGEEIVVVHVTAETREIQGVDCRVVADAVVVGERDEDTDVLEYIPVEITDDWFAQDTAGDVYYCGEIARNFEDGQLLDIDGSFEAGRNFAKAGILFKAFPVAGDVHRQEFALGEAEDIVQYVEPGAVPSFEEGGENPAFPCAPDGCLKTFEFAPLDPESTEFKYYLPGTGFVLAVAMEDGELTGEREELVCIGDSLALLEDPSCAIENPEELLDALCELAPKAFCQ